MARKQAAQVGRYGAQVWDGPHVLEDVEGTLDQVEVALLEAGFPACAVSRFRWNMVLDAAKWGGSMTHDGKSYEWVRR